MIVMGWTIGDYLGNKAPQVRLECPTGKVAFHCRSDANAALKKQAGHRTQMKAFRCGYCEKYHLGHRRGAIL